MVILACSSSNDPFNSIEKKQSNQERIDALLNMPNQIKFNDIRTLVFEPRCLSCHSGEEPEGGFGLENLRDIDAQGERLIQPGFPDESPLYNVLNLSEGPRQMPPEPQEALSEDERNLIYQWILNGAPGSEEESRLSWSPLSEKLKPYFEDPKKIDYRIVKKYVFEPGRCYACHTHQGHSADRRAILFGADFNSYSRLFLLGGIVKGRPSDLVVDGGVGPPRIEKGSRIYQSIAVDQSMPPSPGGNWPLSALRVKLLRLWILNCAIENYNDVTHDNLIEGSPTERVRRCL